jgi:hypothetical protein
LSVLRAAAVLSCIVGAAWPRFAESQPATALTGRVMDASGSPVAGARVACGDAATWVDAEGVFGLTMAAEPPAGAVVRIEAKGYEALSVALGAARTDLTFVLSPARAEGAGVLVSGRRAPAGQTRHSLDRETLRGVAGTGGDPLRALTLMPGFSRSPYGAGRLIVRGARENSSAVFVDGMRVPHVFHFGLGPSVFAPDMIDRIDFYPGNYPARYGQLTGGVIDVALRPGDADHWQGAVDVDLADAGAFAQGPVGETTVVAVSLRRSYVDGVLTAGADWFDIQDATNVVPVYWDYQARVDHTPKAGSRLSLMVVGSRDDLSFLEDPSSPDATRLTATSHWDRIKATFEQRLGPGSTLTISPSLGVDTTNMVSDEEQDDSAASEDSSDDDRRQEATLRVELNGPLSTEWRGLAGLELVSRAPGVRVVTQSVPQARSGDGGFSGRVPEATQRALVLASPYLEATGRWPFGLSVVPAVRADLASIDGNRNLSLDPRVTVRQLLSPGLTGKLALGRYSQILGTVRRPALADDPRVVPARAWHYGAGLEWQANAATTVTSDLWLSRRVSSGRARWTLGVDEDTGTARGESAFIHGQTRAYGWEFLLKAAPAARVSGWISYSLARVEQRRPGDPWQRAPFDGTHRLTTVWNTRLPAGWGLGVSGTLASGYPDPIEGGVFDARAGAYTPLRASPDADRRLPMYHQVDLRLEKTWTGEVADTVGYVDLINVGNAANTEGWDWDYRYAAPRPVRGVPVFPALGLQVRFK